MLDFVCYCYWHSMVFQILLGNHIFLFIFFFFVCFFFAFPWLPFHGNPHTYITTQSVKLKNITHTHIQTPLRNINILCYILTALELSLDSGLETICLFCPDVCVYILVFVISESLCWCLVLLCFVIFFYIFLCF